MRYWRLFSFLFLLTFTITGCHRRPEAVVPPPQAQAPIISTLPSLPSLTLNPVLLAEPMLAPPPKPPATIEPKEQPSGRIRHRRTARKPAPDTTAPESHPSSAEDPLTAPQSASSSAVVGTLSTDDSATNPDKTAQTENLIRYTEDRLKKVSLQQQQEHKDTIAQIGSFLTQARQALSTNDQVGAQTLANKAKILVDELLK